MTIPFSTETQKSHTRGNLVPARLYAADEKGNDKKDLSVNCSFNPYEYTVSQSNSYDYKPTAGADTKVEFKSAGPQTLTLSLIFDAYENENQMERDVSQTTRKLWLLMTPEDINIKKPDAPFVVFEWGVFKFVAVITNMIQKFILFDHKGVPLRAKVDITFTQYKSETKDYQTLANQDESIPETAIALPNDRLESISANNLGDPANWRDVATANNITNPLALRPGQNLLLPGGKNG